MIKISEIIEHEIEQRSEEWFAIRTGKLTGSHFAEIMPSDKSRVKWTLAQEKAVYKIAAEIMTGLSGDKTFINEAMQWGIDHEEEARKEVEMYFMDSSRECGIFQRGQYIASSPDAIIGDNDMTLEIKCPSSAVHLKYFKDPESLWKEYKWQVLGEMYCTGLDKGIIASYDPRFIDESKRLVVYEPKDYSDDLIKLEERLGEVELKIQEIIS
jgi:putative phage-type endonuclease